MFLTTLYQQNVESGQEHVILLVGTVVVTGSGAGVCKGAPTEAIWTWSISPGSEKSGRSRRARSAVIFLKYSLLIGTSVTM